jgi:sigma-B regulation protein RsbU (phosphoserine phosphatase)
MRCIICESFERRVALIAECPKCAKRYKINTSTVKKPLSLIRFNCKACGFPISVNIRGAANGYLKAPIQKKPNQNPGENFGLTYTRNNDFSGGIFGSVSIKFKFIIPFLLLITATLTITGVASVMANAEIAKDYAMNLLDQTSRNLLTRIDNYLQKPKVINATNADLMKDLTIDVSSREKLLRHFYQQGKIYPNYGTIAFANNQGEFYGANAPEDYIVLADRNLTYGSIRRYQPDADGYRTEQILKEKQNYDATQRNWYKEAVAAQKPIWTTIEPSVTGQRLDCSAVYPVTNGFEVKGVFLVDVSLQEISQYIKEQKIGKNGQAYLIEKTGEIVSGSLIAKPFRINSDGSVKRLNADSITFPLVKEIYTQALNGGHDLTHIKEAGQKRFTFDNETWLLQTTPFKQNNIEWILFVLVPESDFNITAKIRNTIIGIWGVILLLVVSIGWIVGNHLSKPLKEISIIGNQISMGRRELVLLPETRKDEIGELIKSFNRLVTSLKVAMQKLNI